METEETREKKKPKGLPVWARILLFALGFFATFGLYSAIGFGVLPLILGDEAGHPGPLGHIVAEIGMLPVVLTSAVVLLYPKRRPLSDLGLTLKGHVRGLWYGLLAIILLYLIGFGLSLALGEVEVTDFQFDPLNLLATFVLCLLVALAEEIMVCDYVFGRLLYTRMNKSLSLSVSALLLTLLHLSNPSLAFLPMLGLLLAGMFIGASYLYTHNLCFPTSLHLSWSWTQGPILGYQIGEDDFGTSLLTPRLPGENVLDGGAFRFEGSLICTAPAIIFTILIVWWGEKWEAISLTIPRSH